MPNRKDLVDRLLVALAEPELAGEAYNCAVQFREEGITQLEMYRVFDAARAQFQDGDPRYDAVLDTMDYIVGYCSPQAKLFPNHYLSNEEIKGSES
jgi:hypothetical protein